MNEFSLDILLWQKSEQMFFMGLGLAFALEHFVLYIYNSSTKTHLYFAAAIFFMVLSIFFDIQNGYFSVGDDTMFYLRLHRSVIPIGMVFMLRFLYDVFYDECPEYYKYIVGTFAIGWLLIVWKPDALFNYYKILELAAIAEFVRIMRYAIKNKKVGAVLLNVGFLCLFVFAMYDTLLDFELMDPINERTNMYYYGWIGLFVMMSIFLSKTFASKTDQIIEQERKEKENEINRRLLEAEDLRKSKELEEARQLQLCMLPDCVNDVPGLDICFHMDTATEVGGDYYDYYVTPDEELTIAIGDATGHGMKAGILVSVIKGLFTAYRSECSITEFFEKASSTIKQMNLGNLYMAFMLVKIKNNELTASSAGMPQIMIYRKKTDSVEEMLIKGMPLGGPKFPYKIKSTKIEKGDVVLMMSDGLAELFNSKKEEFDFERISSSFLEASRDDSLNSTQIKNKLIEAGGVWRGEEPQNDDITLVVVRVRPN